MVYRSQEEIYKKLFWLGLALAILAQFLFTQNSTNQVRYEELAESVRNVYWLSQGRIYDGMSSNIGWYGSILFFYHTFGFYLYFAKIFRLILAVISLFCLAKLLTKYLSPQFATLAFLAFGLSPTLLYFNTSQASYGIDLQYLPIALFLISALDFSKKWLFLLTQFSLWTLIMVAWMSYPTIIYYLPALVLLYLWKLRRSNQLNWKNLSLSIVAFLLPLVCGVLFVADRQLLLYDAKTSAGIFRGAGTFQLSLSTFFTNLGGLSKDLFISGSSYNFEVANGEFSQVYPIIALITVFIFGIFGIRHKGGVQKIYLLTFFTLFFGLVVANFAVDPSTHPGARRGTWFIASFYTLYTLALYMLNKVRLELPGLKITAILILGLIPAHHLLILPSNLSHLTDPSGYRYTLFLGEGSPDLAISAFTEQTTKESLKLSCQDELGNPLFCRYAEIFGAVKANCLWNRLDCKEILGYDPKSKDFIPLSIKTWQDYYFEH